ncbi:hypothetical protein BHE74_00041772 [Ensete ventricosum]|nr:hypothetical protein GW17_00028993 [Ensete ventricosum]RWW51846.1 hypothetical protein BHE74_00041772 [Ensete ventricosum]RZR86028.1 hypothetical protein BHM03_00013124 [Ensete ventricosum]
MYHLQSANCKFLFSFLFQDATLPPKWIAFRTIIFNEKEDGFHDSERIAAFDFDGCLVNTSVKRYEI